MGKLPTFIDDAIRQFIHSQSLFFVGTAPLQSHGHVNISPKGLDTFRILNSTSVAYLDLTGSGIETIAHLKENGRIVIMFCAFHGPPKILRLHGQGCAVQAGDAGFPELERHFPKFESTRAIVLVEVTRVSTSCGYGVPLLKYEGERPQLNAWARNKGIDGLSKYRNEKNHASIDGLPGLSE